MKVKIVSILILSILWVGIGYAQTSPQIQLNLQPGQSYSQAIAGTMQQLNTSRIPYNTLYNMVVG
ncbi:MAG: hypothetical protein Q4G63_07480 [Bacteroidia bacterium]|nr:hypothetical protein [Bacteroidia bacterium]